MFICFYYQRKKLTYIQTQSSQGIHFRMLLILKTLEGTALYAGFLLAPAEGFILWPRFFFPFGQKRTFYAVFAYFWCPVVTSKTVSTNQSNFEKKKKKNPKNSLKKYKNLKNPKKNKKNSIKSPKFLKTQKVFFMSKN